MADKDQFDFGERVQSFVDDAVDSLNFENLNSNIQKTINSAFDSSAGGGVQYHYGGDRAADQKSVYRRLMAQNPPESLSGALERVIGLACLLLFGVTGGICFAIPIISAGIICMALAAGGAYLFKRGRDKKQRVEHFRVFRRIIGNKIVNGRQVTGIGEKIRSGSWDEWPQFFNVLRGQMSIIGTRPPTVDEWEKYKYHHRARLATKPGLTGMWQVSGRSKITDFEEVVKLDTEYINHWSIGLDIRILFKTVKAVLTKDGAM